MSTIMLGLNYYVNYWFINPFFLCEKHQGVSQKKDSLGKKSELYFWEGKGRGGYLIVRKEHKIINTKKMTIPQKSSHRGKNCFFHQISI